MNLYFTLWAQAKQEYMIVAIWEPCNPLLTVHMDDDIRICNIWVDILQAPSWLSLHYPSITQYMGILDSIKDIMMCIMGNPTNSANFT